MTDPNQLPPEYLNKLDALRKRHQQAAHLADQHKYTEAIAAFQHCFQFAAQEHFPLLIEQFIDLWMRIADCQGNLNRYEEALKIYLPLEKILNDWVAVVKRGQDIDTWMIENNSQVDWAHLLPSGVTFMIPRDYDPRTSLAAVYEAMGLAYDNSQRPPEALACYQKAIAGYTQLGDVTQVARTWKYRAVGCQRRQEWPDLAEAAGHLRDAAHSLNDVNGLIDAYAMLFLAAFNQRETLQAIEYLRHAIDLEKPIHPLLARDQKTLAEVLGGIKKMAMPKAGARPLPLALTQPETWAGLFDQVTPMVKADKGGPQLVFTLHTKRFDEAVQLLRAFSVTVTPLGAAQLRALPEPPDFEVPADAQLLIQFTLDDIAPHTPLVTLSLPKGQAAALAQANAVGRGFTLSLDGGSSGGFLGKGRLENWRYDQVVLDWEGWEGVSRLVRTKWGDSPEAVESLVESLHNRLKRGPATGLSTELGHLYQLQDEEASAVYWYQQEVRLNQKADGTPGPGSAPALGRLGLIHKQRDEADLARAYFQLALSLNPNHYDALAQTVGSPDDLGNHLQELARLYRLRQDEQTLGRLIELVCEDKPLTAEELATVVHDLSAEADMSHPLPRLKLENPAATLANLMSDFAAAPPPLTHLPPARPEAAEETVAHLTSLHEVAQVLTQFAARYGHAVPVLTSKPVMIEEMVEYRKDKQGKLTVTNVPGAVLPLATDPELILRVTLRGGECILRLMQLIQLPGTAEMGLKSMFSKRLPAQVDGLTAALDALITDGVLVEDGQQLRYRAEG